MAGDFITLHRKALRSWLWDMPAEQGKVALTLLMMANWKKGTTFSGGKMVTVERGQVMTSLPRLAEHARVSIRTVRTSLKNLAIAEFLTDRATAKFRIITILNYDEYQSQDKGERQAERQDGDSLPTAHRQDSDSSPTAIEQGNKGTKEQGKKAGARKRAHQIPDSWKPTDKHTALAAELGVDLADEAEKFRDYWLGEGKPKTNWNATFNNWLRNAKKWAGNRQDSNPYRPKLEAL